MKKLTLLLLSLVLLLTLSAGHAEDFNEMEVQELLALRADVDKALIKKTTAIDHSDYSLDGFVYVSNGSEVHINLYEGTNPNVVIPAEIEGMPVTKIHEKAFRNNLTIQTVVVSEGITQLPEGFLYGCKNLISVSLPEGIEDIPSECFDCCTSLVELNIPLSVKRFSGHWVIGISKIKNITFHEGLEEIARGAFQSADSLEGIIVFPTTLKEIGEYAFSLCKEITGFVIQSDITVGESCFDGGKVELLYIKDGCSVTFKDIPFGSNLKTAILPSSVTSIGDEVFSKSNMLTIVCPAGSYAESYAKSHFIMCNTELYDQYVQEYDEMMNGT